MQQLFGVFSDGRDITKHHEEAEFRQSHGVTLHKLAVASLGDDDFGRVSLDELAPSFNDQALGVPVVIDAIGADPAEHVIEHRMAVEVWLVELKQIEILDAVADGTMSAAQGATLLKELKK